MPTYKVTDPQSGKTVSLTGDSPPTEKELMQIFESLGVASQPKEKTFSENVSEFGTGLNRGLAKLAGGIGQRLGVFSQRDVDAALSAMNQERKGEGMAGKAGEFVGETAPTFLIPGGGVTGGIARKIATSSLSGAMQGALQPTSSNESVVTNMAIGAGMGGATSGLMSAGGKVINAFKGDLKPSGIADLGDKYKIPTTLGEKTENPTLKGAEILNQKVPLSGTTSFRIKQNEAAKQSATDHFSQYVVDPSLDTTAAMKVSNDAYLDGLYKSFAAKAKTLPEGEAPTLKNVTGDLLDRYPSVFESIQDNNIKKILRDVYGDVKDKTVNTGIVNVKGNPITRQQTPTFTATELWDLRKGIGQEIRDAKTETARSQLGKIYSAVSSDLDSVLSKSKDPLVSDFKTANESFKQYSLKFDAMREVYDRAVGTTKAGEFFSPKTYATALKNLANDPNYKKNIKWTPGEIENMTGLANILQVVKEAGRFQENPANGSRLLSYELISSLAKTPLLPISLVTTFLTTTKPGQNLMRSASTVTPSSATMGKIVKQIYEQAPKIAATAGNEFTNSGGQ